MKKTTHNFQPTPFIKSHAEIMEPGDSEPPILVAPVRESVFQWMTELNAEDKLQEVGIKPRRKLLFFGPPGCGKTTLAHHVASRLGLPLIVLNMQAMASEYISKTGQNLNQLFADCRPQQDDCILFLDEFDCLADKRGNSDQSAGKEQNNIVIALLQKIDSYGGTIIAATNRGDSLDPAIWRRFEMRIDIGEPDAMCRFAIIKRYLAPFELDDDSITEVTAATAGATPAMLRQLCESIKRDLVIGPKMKVSLDCTSVLTRATLCSQPHAESVTPRLWEKPGELGKKLEQNWPPERKK